MIWGSFEAKLYAEFSYVFGNALYDHFEYFDQYGVVWVGTAMADFQKQSKSWFHTISLNLTMWWVKSSQKSYLSLKIIFERFSIHLVASNKIFEKLCKVWKFWLR